MRVLVKDHGVVLVPDTDIECESVDGLLAAWGGHAFRAFRSGSAAVLEHAGPYDVVFGVPINVTSRHPDAKIRLISNFAATPFELDGQRYASVEGFWQSLRAANRQDRLRIALLTGGAARKAGQELEAPAVLDYQARSIAWSSPEHWDLMRVACRAKFSQVDEARAALLATRPRPLEHRMQRDSRSIPGVVLAGIWMHLREEFVIAAARAGHYLG